MRRTYKLTIYSAIVLCILSMVSVSSFLFASERTYEIHPQVHVDGRMSDTELAIEGYDRLTERFIALMQTHFQRLERKTDKTLKGVRQLQSQMDTMDRRLTRIEQALGIAPEQKDPNMISHPDPVPSPAN